MRVKYNLLFKGEEVVNALATKYPPNELIQYFQFGSNQYLNLSPAEYISIDIRNTNDRWAAWTDDLSINLGKRSLFDCKRALKKLIKSFEIPELFFYTKENKLMVNQELAKEHQVMVVTPKKYMTLIPAVVPDMKNQEIYHEGAVFMIGKSGNFCYLTYDDICFLLDQLEQFQWGTYMLAMLMIAFGNQYQPITITETDRTIKEEKEVLLTCIPDANEVAPKAIPDI